MAVRNDLWRLPSSVAETRRYRPFAYEHRESTNLANGKMKRSLAAVYRYHDGTKHSFRGFARSLGYLDWASQPRPFRAFAGAQIFPLHPTPGVSAAGHAAAIGDVLRHSLGLSAWKRFDKSRWALRVNPSSGNLHPTEGYVICGALHGLADQPALYH